MEHQCTQGTRLEEVHQRFEGWRKERRRGAPIPSSLWKDAVNLCADYSISRVSRLLRLGHNVLKRRVQAAFPARFSEGKSSSWSQSRPASCLASPDSTDFIAVDLGALGASVPELIIEMESLGKRMHIHIKGMSGFHPEEVIRTFWGQR